MPYVYGSVTGSCHIQRVQGARMKICVGVQRVMHSLPLAPDFLLVGCITSTYFFLSDQQLAFCFRIMKNG